MSSHFFYSESLPRHGLNSQVWWSHNPTGEALVFVHGFRGQSLATWLSFPSMLTGIAKLAGWDLIFFGYDGEHTEMVSSATDLEALLDALMLSPANVYAGSGAWPHSPRVHPSSYRRIVLVGHSLGTVVSRRALLNGYQRTAPWAGKTELVLYAPAHNGAKLGALLQETLGLLGSVLSMSQLFGRYIVLRDLKIGSPALSNLKNELRLEYDAGNAPTLKSREVVWARNDRVVDNAVLYPDAPSSPASNLNGLSHSTVCKPNNVDTRPFDLLISVL